jgi:hypothetical protein
MPLKIACVVDKTSLSLGFAHSNCPSNSQSAYTIGISCLGNIAQTDSEEFLRFSLYLTHDRERETQVWQGRTSSK